MKNLAITENKDAQALSPRGCNVNYVILSVICGVAKVGRSNNLVHDFRAAKRYYPDATLVAVKWQGSKEATFSFEDALKSFVTPYMRANGNATEVYPIAKLDDILRGF